jgi:hypothetical protein
MAGVERSQDDRLLQLRAGEMWSGLQAATALSERTNARFQQAWERGAAFDGRRARRAGHRRGLGPRAGRHARRCM